MQLFTLSFPDQQFLINSKPHLERYCKTKNHDIILLSTRLPWPVEPESAYKIFALLLGYVSVKLCIIRYSTVVYM
jgi:hypothetical protein